MEKMNVAKRKIKQIMHILNPLAGKVKVRITDKQDTVTKFYHRDDVTVLSTKNGKDKGENPKK